MFRVFLLLLVVLFARQSGGTESWRMHTIDNSSRGADGVRIADVNRDGWPDIATGWEEGGRVRVYLNPGPGHSKEIWPRVTVGNVASPEDAVFADLDEDGAVDVVSCCEGRNRTVYAHWAPPNPAQYLQEKHWHSDSFACSRQKQSWMFALPMQVDRRHGLDLVVGSKGAGATIGWLEAPPDPRQMTAWKFHAMYQAGWIMSLQAHDMDRDGDLDVLASDRKGPTRGVLWLENPGSQTAADPWPVHRLGGADREVMFLSLSRQFQNQTRYVVSAVRGSGILLLRDSGTAADWTPRELPMPPRCGTGKGAAVGDIDLDGWLDLVFSCENAGSDKSGVRWLRGGRTYRWDDREISGPLGVKFDRLELLDLDDDGDLDVLTCEETANLGVIWYENPAR